MDLWMDMSSVMLGKASAFFIFFQTYIRLFQSLFYSLSRRGKMKEMWVISDGEKPIALFNSKREAEQEFDIMGLASSSLTGFYRCSP